MQQDGCLRHRTNESWRRSVDCACVKDDSEIPSRRTAFLGGRSGSSKPRHRFSRFARLSMVASYTTMYAFSIDKNNPKCKGHLNSILNIARVQ
jgi:hypothetical protein